ncbi:SpoIIE family protein phosphatase [Paramaledivibacter caminithermalis]|uniref:Stage II sporulation protein E (SpoIIE) n=1 Tax=Paramaledivibacter caminithermalis (strain DSM 15212 / CIP 107654 / DViRD3) TaxID=1121301 RepID=A0A1M6TKF2_PARC5|nr:SpoIIE family protein phosphatase [Paramaledivibacter caminithermalis]SHK57424.1 Stage II sporulation protein E (SpoIIE) [Paramaledivibacter caminithermalis DSM 15212]
MSFFIDISYDSLNKYGEELCGDKVEVAHTDDSVIIVLADGLGSGVKANILSTLTSKIAATMLKEGSTIYETVDTIVNTLPECKVRKLAYSTFTIVKIYKNGKVYIVECDNPPIFFIRGNKILDIKKIDKNINGKLIKESEFMLEKNDVLTIVSDGVIHAGIGGVLNLGWQWENVAEYLERLSKDLRSAKNISKGLVNACNNLYANKPGDDTTVATIKIREPEIVNIFTGPPKDPEKDKYVIEELMKSQGKRIVCGGTAAKIASRELKEELITDIEYIDKEVPPTAHIKGIDLVTEGVLTLSKAVEKIKEFMDSCSGEYTVYNPEKKDGASILAKILIEECTHINLWVGKAVNPAHQNPDLPIDLSIKLKVVGQLVELMRKLGKNVKLINV